MNTEEVTMWTTSHAVTTPAAASSLWHIIEAMHSGEPIGSKSDMFELHGAFAVGTSITVTPQGQDPVQSVITVVDRERCYADETRIGPLALTFRYDLEPVAEGTRVTHTLTIEGEGAAEAGPTLGAQISADFPDTMRELVEAAEQHAEQTRAEDLSR